MAVRTKKQHIVPRFYLDKFRDENGLVWTYADRVQPLGLWPEKTAVISNYYSPPTLSGERCDGIEELLGTIESDAAPLWNKVFDGRVLYGEEREKFALFLAAQYLRSPSAIGAGAEIAGHLVQHFARAVSKDNELHNKSLDRYEVETRKVVTSDERDDLREFLSDPKTYKINVLHATGLPVLGATADLADIFFSMKWRTGKSNDQHLITSDCPVTRVSDPKTHRPIFGDGGFLNRTVRVYFPLSPERILELTWLGEERERLAEIPRSMAREMNAMIAANADRYLYAGQFDSGIAALCNKWLSGKKPQRIRFDPEAAEVVVKRKL